MIFIELFITFAKIGLFTFGGGYAMISLIEDSGKSAIIEGTVSNQNIQEKM